MGITAIHLLDAGVAMSGRLPDIYWDLNLSGTEIKVLRYVYNHCLRLYRTVRIFPKGVDGSPRFWRGKEQMADDCGVSYPTFRNNIRHLHELGLVTSMDGDVESSEPYCVGLTCDFLNEHISKLYSEKDFRCHLTFLNLIELLFSDVKCFLNNEDLEKFRNYPLLFSYENNKPDGTKELDIHTNTQETPHKQNSLNNISLTEPTQASQKSKKLQKINRKPIIVGRQPILVMPESIRLQSAQQKLKLLQNVRTPHDKKLLEICEYYEFKCRQVLHSTGFRAIGKDFRNHKNWKFLDRLNSLCEENQWDYRLYVDSQFDRVKYWERKQVYPYLNQFFSQNAIKYYHNFLKDYTEKSSITGTAKKKAGKIKSVQQQIIDDVVKDCDSISEWMSVNSKRRSNKDLSPEHLKILYLSDHWFGLSISYLSTIPWFVQYLEQFSEESFIVDMKSEIQMLKGNRKTYDMTVDIVRQVEKQFELPETLCL